MPSDRVTPSIKRAWYSAPVSTFLEATPDSILGDLVRTSEFTLLTSQRDAWLEQVAILQHALTNLDGTLYLEFNIPRMGKRIDAVLVLGPAVFVIEFKVGEAGFAKSAIEQVWDYALDLKNFHEGSHAASLIPILVATAADGAPLVSYQADPDDVYRPILATPASLRATMDDALRRISAPPVIAESWSNAPYKPTPTIIEAARALYAQHSVEAIARHDAGARNLHVTSQRLLDLIDEARTSGHKILCLVTGVPGAGKTLVGLNVATQRRDEASPTHAVFLSGNGPLVKVLLEALARDEFARQLAAGKKAVKGHIRESIKSFIQNVHHFRDEALVDPRPPHDRVAIFDEAQRAWNAAKAADFMRRKRKRPDFKQSEPEFLISTLNRHEGWAAIVCLVGGGQEINTGEAGISAWIDAALKTFPDWHLHISSRLTDTEYAAGHVLESVRTRPNTHIDDDLHLSVSMRSFRAESVSSFVKSVLDLEEIAARDLLDSISAKYPVVLTRDLEAARSWIRSKARGSERYGLVASSKAQRLKPHAIDVRVEIDPVHWFLNHREDTRSSYYLEDAATEFQVQGLELDWTCVTWDADLRYTPGGWSYHDFRGSRWTSVRQPENQNYLRNAYRVLLTRARQGMVIFVPPGDSRDPTRDPRFYDPTFEYLRSLSLPVL